MAEYDDDRPDFDAIFRDPPPDDPRAARRRASRPADTDFDFDDDAGTGEVRRPPRPADDPPPRPADPDAGFDVDEDADPAPRRRSRGSGGGRPRPAPRQRERGSRGRRASSGGARSGGRRTGGGAVALQGPRGRLLLTIAFAAILVVVVLFVVRDCQRSQLKDSYTQYMNGVAQIVTTSAAQGTDLRRVLANRQGDKPPELKTKIAAIAKDARGLVDRADDLDPPGSLSSAQRSLVAGVLEYRVIGLTKLAENLPTLLQSKDQQTTASGIAANMKRFLASDVIYEDSFKGPAAAALKDDDITGIEVPPLQPFLPNAALASADGAKSLLPALQNTSGSGSATVGAGSGNLLGTSLESTVASPSDTRLTPGDTATVQSTELLTWRVTVKNGGDFDVKNVIVKASFSYPAAPDDIDTREVEIAALAAGDSTTVEIGGPSSEAITFGEQGTLKIEVAAVSGETKIDNNSAEYPVVFTI